MNTEWMYAIAAGLPLILGWVLDRWLGDPVCLPHPVVAYGKAIAACEHRFNRGAHRRLKGGVVAVSLIVLVYAVVAAALYGLSSLTSCWRQGVWLEVGVKSVLVFYCLAGTTLVREVRAVFRALDRSLEDGRKQVARIVGRDTDHLSAQEVRQAALETLAENLSDGVVAPLFWFTLLGVPGMMAYKMVNTLDSMIGYRTARYKEFGCVAARIDDAANLLPARITALLMLAVAMPWRRGRLRFLFHFASCHLSPNSGWPEAALAAVLDCRFGGTHDYFGETVSKPYIGINPRPLTTADMERAVSLNRKVELVTVALSLGCFLLIYLS